MSHEIGHYTIVDYKLFEKSIHAEAQKQLDNIKRRAKEDRIEDYRCLVCGKEFCLIISPTFFEKGLRELCEVHNREYHQHVHDGRNGLIAPYHELAEDWASTQRYIIGTPNSYHGAKALKILKTAKGKSKKE